MTSGPIVVGVQPGQAASVVQEAARVATVFGVELVCAHVDADPTLARGIEGGAAALGAGLYIPTDPDPDPAWTGTARFDPALRDQIATALHERPSGARWRTEHLFGEPAAALGQLAELLDAPMIVVGTREAGVGRTVHDFFMGSAAVHLTHRQHRPVLVVPAHPVSTPGELPWLTETERP